MKFQPRVIGIYHGIEKHEVLDSSKAFSCFQLALQILLPIEFECFTIVSQRKRFRKFSFSKLCQAHNSRKLLMARFFRCSIVFVSLTFSVSVVFSTFATSTISASLLENVEFEPPQHPQLASIEMNDDDTIMKSSLSSSSSSSSSSQPSSQYQFWGKYAHIRSQLDYNYHSYYHPERQVLQDSIIELMMNSTTVMDSSTISLESSSGGHSKSKSNSTQIIQTCSTPASDPWIVFTAGAMGAGKTHTIRYLHQHQHFPLKAFVTVDPVSFVTPITLSFVIMS